MCSKRALQSLTKSPLLRFISSTPQSILLNPIPKSLSFHSSRRLAAAVTAMTGANSSGGCSQSDHVAGDWYSVPDLRLRDHSFTAPLDYSLDCSTCPKITIFAREVVSGTVIGFLIMLSLPSFLLIGLDLMLLLLLSSLDFL